MNEEEDASFDIVLNGTKEIVGLISFDYFSRSGFSYLGNVDCNIKKAFRNGHYATKALALLKRFI